MPTESELREVLSRAQSRNSLDARAIIKRSQARRLPRQLGAGAIGTLAILGISVVGIQALRPADLPVITAIEQESALATPEGALDRDSITLAPAERLNLCGGTLAEVAPARSGLQLDVEFPASAPLGRTALSGIVRLTNTGGNRVVGSTAAMPTVTVSQQGVVVWHSNGPLILSRVNIDLAPAESLEYATSIELVRCVVNDDRAESFPADLALLESGEYELSAAIDFSPTTVAGRDAAGGDVDLVTGPRSTILLGAR